MQLGPRATVGLLAMLVVLGCSCEQSAPGDATPRDAALDAATDRGSEAAHDSRADLLEPDASKRPCGVDRKLSPKVITPYAPTPCGTGCKQISFGQDPFLQYDIVGDLVVYTNGNGAYGWRVSMVDLKSGKEQQLHPDWDNVSQGCSRVATDGTKLAYTCILDRASASVPTWTRTITVFDPATNIAKDVYCMPRKLADDPCYPSFIAMGTTGIALNMSLTACSKIDALFYRYADGTLTNVSKTYGGVGALHMSGRYIAYKQDERAMVFDTVTNTAIQLDKKATAAQCQVHVEGDKVVWSDMRNGKGDCWDPKSGDIYMHDLKTHKTVAISTHKAQQEWPDVWGDWVVWQDWRNAKVTNPGLGPSDKSDIYAKHLPSGKEVQLTDFKGYSLRPRIHGNKVIYRMRDTWGVALFLIDLDVRYPSGP